jgi:hypothetical protein
MLFVPPERSRKFRSCCCLSHVMFFHHHSGRLPRIFSQAWPSRSSAGGQPVSAPRLASFRSHCSITSSGQCGKSALMSACSTNGQIPQRLNMLDPQLCWTRMAHARCHLVRQERMRCVSRDGGGRRRPMGRMGGVAAGQGWRARSPAPPPINRAAAGVSA